MDQILYMQAGIANMYMKKHKLSPKEFLKLDKKLDILGFIQEGYEPFHLMGDRTIQFAENLLAVPTAALWAG